MNMHPVTCHPQMPAVKEAYFATFTPATLALICEATLLEPKLRAMAGVPSTATRKEGMDNIEKLLRLFTKLALGS